MASFPALAEPLTVSVKTLAPETLDANGLEEADYAVLEPGPDGVVHVREATVDEVIAYERAHGETRIYESSEEFLDALERGFKDE